MDLLTPDTLRLRERALAEGNTNFTFVLRKGLLHDWTIFAFLPDGPTGRTSISSSELRCDFTVPATGVALPVDAGSCHHIGENMAIAKDNLNDSVVYYDPYDVNITADPYPTYARLREEAPVYYNERYDFWALSRHADVEKALVELGDVLKSTKRHPRTGEVRLRHAQGRHHVRGPARAHDVARADVAGLHTASDGRDRGPDTSVLHHAAWTRTWGRAASTSSPNSRR